MGIESSRRNEWNATNSKESLKEQISRLKKEIHTQNKLFAVSFRFFVLIFLFTAVFDKTYSESEPVSFNSILFFSLTFYLFYLIYFLKDFFKKDNKPIKGFIKITFEILLIYFVIWYWPSGRVFIYASSVNIVLSIIILLAPLSGRWWFALYSGTLIAVMHYTLSTIYYPYFLIKFEDSLLIKYLPEYQHKWYAIYYFIEGVILSFVFYLFFKNQELSFNIKTNSLISKTYFDLCLSDTYDYRYAKYIIKKKSFFPDSIIGADFVAVKQNRDNSLNLIVGDSIGHGINRSPGAVATMAAFKAIESSNPITILKKLNDVLSQVDYQYGGSALAVVFRLDKAGYIEYAGRLEDFLAINYKTLETERIQTQGKILGIHKKYDNTQLFKKEINSDIIYLIQTDGAKNKDEHDDQTVVSISWED